MLLLDENVTRQASSPQDRAAPAPRICVVIGGHLTTCPRMLKAADSLADAGYAVRVVSTSSAEWAREGDEDARKSRQWIWNRIDCSRQTAPLRHGWCGLRYRTAGRAARLLGAGRCPLGLAVRAYSRVHSELVSATLAEPAELIYGGTGAAMAAVAEASRRARTPYALDLEDFHSGELNGSPGAELMNRLAGRIEEAVLEEASFVTAGSAAISAAYHETYGIRPIPINNTFPLPACEPDFSPSSGDGLRLYWFSLTFGRGRGLEDVVRAMGLAEIPGELHLRGKPARGYLESLLTLASESAPRLRIVCHPPAPPDAMIPLCRGYDLGLALEPGISRNNSLALSNKVFSYLLAALGLVLTDTPGQRPLAWELGERAIVYRPGDVGALASQLRERADDKSRVAQAKRASWEAARRRWHWEHPQERGALLGAVARALA